MGIIKLIRIGFKILRHLQEVSRQICCLFLCVYQLTKTWGWGDVMEWESFFLKYDRRATVLKRKRNCDFPHNSHSLKLKAQRRPCPTSSRFPLGGLFHIFPQQPFCSISKDDVQPFLYVLISTQGGNVWRTPTSPIILITFLISPNKNW